MGIIENGKSTTASPHAGPFPAGERAKPGGQAPIGASRAGAPRIGDDVAYMLPMAAFLAFTWAGGHWPSFFVASYIAKTFVTVLLLAVLWPHYTKVRWDYWWLGAILGVVGLFQWVYMEKGLLHVWPHHHILDAGEPLDPLKAFASPAAMWSFIAIRWAGATLVVPVMEELFWRDFLWRTIVAPADFKLARLGEWGRGLPLLLVSLAFCTVHFEWLTALAWGLMIGGLLVLTRSLGACIIMHAVTNFLLGGYVLYFRDWRFW